MADDSIQRKVITALQPAEHNKSAVLDRRQALLKSNVKVENLPPEQKFVKKLDTPRGK
jgi:hypothetical protein